jgi:hypothetical protein
MTKQFEEGQIWRTRDGALVKITAVLPAMSRPIVASPYCPYDKTCNELVKHTFSKDGHFFVREWHGNDLVELVEPKAKEFAVGQVWKQANGDHVKITSVTSTSMTYPISAWYCDETGENLYGNEEAYTLDGKYFAGKESECDLVGLVKTVEPTPAPSLQFKVGQVWESRNGEKFTITYIDHHPVYPIEAVNGFCCPRFTSKGNYWDSCGASKYDLIALISCPESQPEPVANPPELQAIFNGEKPVYVVVVEDDRGSANKRSAGIQGEPIVFETSIIPGNSFASFREALERQKSLGNRYGTNYIAECRIIPATRLDK